MSDPIDMRVDRVLRELPSRRAPASLEARVLREIAHRASSPWWQSSFARWPRVARAGFLVTCASIVIAVLTTWLWAPPGVMQAGSWAAGGRILPWARLALTLVDVVRRLDTAIAHAIPPGWLYGAAAAGAILYGALIALGAAAYRAFYWHPSPAGDRS